MKTFDEIKERLFQMEEDGESIIRNDAGNGSAGAALISASDLRHELDNNDDSYELFLASECEEGLELLKEAGKFWNSPIDDNDYIIKYNNGGYRAYFHVYY